MSKVRFGLIGYGRFGRLHAQAIANTSQAELVAIAARSAETCAAAQAAHPEVAVVTDYHDLLKHDDVEVVDVAAPNHLHFEVGRAALEAGKHLFIEKPMTTSLDHCRQLNALARDSGRLLAVGFKRRVAHLWRQVKQLVDNGVVGEPRYAMFDLWRWPYRQGSQGWRYDPDRVGNWILEEPVHSFDMARWLLGALGEPVSIYAAANSTQPDRPDLHHNFSAVVQFPGSAHVLVTQTLSAWGHHHSLRLTGTEGALWAKWSGARDSDLQPVSSLQYLKDDEPYEVPLPPSTGELFELEQEMAMMVRAVTDGEPVVATGQDGAWSVALCEGAQQSIETGQAVSLADVDLPRA